MRSDNKRKNEDRDDPVVRNFLDYLKVEKGLTPLTVGAYKSDLIQFAEFLAARRRELDKATREDVRGFMSQLFANGVKDRSVARKLSTLRHFYKYLLLDRIVQEDPTLEIDSPKQWKVLPKSLAQARLIRCWRRQGRRATPSFPRQRRNATKPCWRCFTQRDAGF